jgi:hypothetical protein
VKQHKAAISHQRIPKDAVLLIPEPESQGEKPAYGLEPGYYDKREMLALLEKHKHDQRAIHFIADMLETGDAANDGFVEMLRKNCTDPKAIAQIIQDCRA